jgi:CDP-diacylglycerol--serine O-phosphatidyltransferase
MAMNEDHDSKFFVKSRLGRRGIYWLPNMFTLAALFSGFYAIVQAMNERFDYAAVGIFAAMVLDGLDGRIARLTRTQSDFGAELDSLSDMVSFGVAPALVVYSWALRDFAFSETVPMLGPWLSTKLGWIAAFIYCACAALRLARFNTNIDIVDKRYFQGLPSPAAACVLAGMVWALQNYEVKGVDVKWLAWALTVFAGLTMVSNLKFYSGKTINLRKRVPFSVLVGIAMGFVFLISIASTLPQMLCAIFLLYLFSGYAIWLWERVRRPGTPPSGAPPQDTPPAS